MKPAAHREEELFSASIALSPADRNAYLAQQCGDDPATLKRVLQLLDGYEKNSLFLESPAGAVDLLPALKILEPLASEPKAGDEIGHYRLVEPIGEGGFGVVYLAEQTQPVRRHVALKLIRLGLDTQEFIARFAAERQALALMDHPCIARVFDAGATATGRPYLVMEFIRGQPITRYCDERALSMRKRLELFLQVCGAIQHAHQKGVIHRDLKPSNILVADEDGMPVPKLIDFGIAKATREPLTDRAQFTQRHVLIGTPAYTSPEQMDTDVRRSDTRSDIYSLGALLYELTTGSPPFARETLRQAGFDELRRIIRETDPVRPSLRVATLFPDERETVARPRGVEPAKLAALLRADLDWIILRCLEKDPVRRYATANALAMDVRRHLENEPVVARPPTRLYRLRKFVRRHRLEVTASATVVGVMVIGSLLVALQARRALRAERAMLEARRVADAQAAHLQKIRWARDVALPEISRLLRKNDAPAAYVLALQAQELLPGDATLTSLWPLISATATIETVPAGADVYAKPYDRPNEPWRYLGKSPLKELRLPRAVHRWRLEKPGYASVEKADGWWWTLDGRRVVCSLFETATNPRGMVRVETQAVPVRIDNLPALADFWIDQHEVTNREFKEFVDHGGYTDERFWKQAFVRDGTTMSWSEAMALMVDRTGHPGPVGWANGTYPENQANYPVTGVSWFEAAAYAEFVGKRLPSVHHWRWAGRKSESEYLLAFANFGSGGPAPVGAYAGVSWCGAVDLAGNAKEWCWNEAQEGRRYLLGGGWREADYMFTDDDALSPFDRGEQNGFRCIRLDPATPVPASLDAPVPRRRQRDYANERPVDDATFALFQREYAYEKTNLDGRTDGGVTQTAAWRRERVSFNTAYDNERIDALIYFPPSARPPYQAIVYFPGSGAQHQHSSEAPRDLPVVEALLATGRAVVYPVYLGTFERPLLPDSRTREVRRLAWCKQVVQDVRRTVDYLETREDFQPGKVAYVGLSWGASWGPIVSALESRITANVFISGGLSDGRTLPEADPFNFAPRVTAPTLMINGRQDFISPHESAQVPLFRTLGTAPEHKRHLLVEGGHGLPTTQAIEEISEWLDRYLGTVNPLPGH